MSNQTNQEILTTSNDYWVDLAEALVRLESNPDFKKVILEGYFRDKAVDGVSMLAHPEVKRRNQRGEVFEALVAISQLQDYFITIKNLGLIDEDEHGPEVDDEDEIG